MKFKIIKFLSVFMIAASLPLFGMMKKTSRLALPKAFLPQSLPKLVDFSQAEAPFLPTVATFPSYDYSGKTYWYQNPRLNRSKWWKKAGLAASSALFAAEGLDVGFVSYIYSRALEANNAQSTLERDAEELEMSENAAERDPELYEVFLKIKKDYGIAEDIPLRIMLPLEDIISKGIKGTKGLNLLITSLRLTIRYCDDVTNAWYDNKLKMIFVSSAYKNRSKNQLIKTLAHELEHHRQSNKYPGSYPRDLDNRLLQDLETFNNFKIRDEIGADAAAADYLYCWKCLGEVADKSTWEYLPKETAAGYVTTRKGYFSKEDYKIYQDRAKEDNALCCAHESQTDKDPATPLKDFLPPIVK